MKFKHYDQNQLVITITDYKDLVPLDDPCLVVNNVIDKVDIKEHLSKYKEAGNTAYHPKMMLKVLYYSYMQGIYSSRKIEARLHRDVCYWYLSAKQMPDFRTIAMFRKKNSKLIESVFYEINKIAMSKGFIDLRLVSLDGTKIKANASKSNNWDKKRVESSRQNEETLRQLLKDFLKETEAEDEKEGVKKENKLLDEKEKSHQENSPPPDKEKSKELALAGSQNELNKTSANEPKKQDNDGGEGEEDNRELTRALLEKKIKDQKQREAKIDEMERALAESGEKSINSTDGDAKVMKSNGRYIVGYNCEAVVDENSSMIVSLSVTSQGNDNNQLPITIEKIKENYARLPEVVLADTGFCDGPSLRYLEENEIEGYIATGTAKTMYGAAIGKKDTEKPFKKNKFKYDKKRDVYICPQKKVLKKTKSIGKQKTKYGSEGYYIYRAENCKECPMFSQCCSDGKNKLIKRFFYEDTKDKMRKKLLTLSGYKIYGKRMALSEGVFGNIKYNMRVITFLLRKLEGVNTEFTLMATAHNLNKMAKMANLPSKNLYRRLFNGLLLIKNDILLFFEVISHLKAKWINYEIKSQVTVDY